MKTSSVFESIEIAQGDITTLRVDAIVNAANTTLLGGGGVDGAIHRAAGSKLLEECIKIGPCITGDAKLTPGFNLPASFVIHTPGPVYKGGGAGEADSLRKSYQNCMILSQNHDFSSIAFPAISTGIYGYPKQEACEIALTTVSSFMRANKYYPKVIFILYDTENFTIYKTTLEKMKSHELS
jgi:O-acetyl-ADP-ribose deacetylase